MIRPHLLFNHEIRRSDEPLLSPGQVGVMNGWGVFSTIKVVDGVLFAFPRHWSRMRRDADLLRVPFPWNIEELEDSLLRLVEANEDFNSTLRVAVVRNRGTIWEGPGVLRDVDLIAFTAPRSNWGEGVRLGIVPQARHAGNAFAGTKITAWATNLVLYEEAHLRGFDEVLLLNEHGRVSECTSANVFAVFGDRVATPPLSEGCLPGVTRDLLLESVHAPGITVEEKPLELNDLEAADAMFVTSSTRDMLPVFEVEGLSIRQDSTIMESLLKAFAAYELDYVSRAARRVGLGQ